MSIRPLLLAASVATLALAGMTQPAQAEEGMWTFDNFPTERVNETYGSAIDQAWMDRVSAAAVRLRGCSASFVSGEGLILTNHHCVVSCIQELSDAETDYVQNGFRSATRDEERTCPGQTAEVLTGITDVTDRVLGAGEGAEGAAFVAARSAEITRIQDEACGDDQTRTCQVISFYRGGRYALYEFQKYTDVRLVFAPEIQSAFFGGDPDNFNFPRYALDGAFLRAYENGQAVTTPNHLTWSTQAPAEGDLVLVAGNPGSTSRLLSIAQLEFLRDVQLPTTLTQLSEMRGRLTEFATRDEESRRIAVDPLVGIENSFKVYNGQLGALRDRDFMQVKRDEEADLRARVAADPALAQRIGDPWSELEAVVAAQADLYLPYRQLEQQSGGGSSLFSYAEIIVRAAKERAKPEAQRRAGFNATGLAAIQRQLVAERQIDAPIEERNIAFWLSKTREYLTADHPEVQSLLGRESPEAIAASVVSGTRLADPAYRAQAWDMDLAQLAALNDPMIDLVLRTDDAAQAVRTQWEERVSAPTSRAAERIARARFAVYGDSQYPDATFSLRLSYGAVQGWTHRGATVPPTTQLGGLYERATGSAPYDLAPSWIAAEGRVDKGVVYNFVSTNDIIGGNSGSPVINAAGEVVGAAFDGNIHSLGGSFGYDGALNRTVSVSTAAITEALRNVYDQPRLLEELGVQ
jgi:hypothetical protein